MNPVFVMLLAVFTPSLGGFSSVPSPVADQVQAPCERAVGEALAAVAELHWNPAIREADSVVTTREACAGDVGVVMAIRRALTPLDDPAIRVLEAAHFERTLEEWNGGARVGIGLAEVLSIDTDETTRRLTIVSPVPGSPAARAGLRTGDVVAAIDGVSTDSLGLTRTVERLRKDEGETVRLSILRDGRAWNVALTAEQMSIVDALRIEERSSDVYDLLHVRLIQFTPGISDTLQARLTSVGDVDGIVLDLRGNPGGMLEELVGTAGVFLPTGSRLSDITGPSAVTLRTDSAPSVPDVPLAVLVGSGTASAAEVLATALRSNDRALIFGEPTYGKGLVHRAVPLVDGRWILMLPVGQLETPEGRRVLGNGIEPDVHTESPLEDATRCLTEPHGWCEGRTK